MKKLAIVALSATLLLTSCQSTSQFYAAATGASIGGMFGSSIGGIMDGPRGHDTGRLMGMVIGAAAGVAATAPKTVTREESNYDYSSDDYLDEYNRHSNRRSTQEYRRQIESEYANLSIDNIRFTDQNGNETIDAGEQAKLTFEIRNHGNETLYDVAPVISVNGTKQIFISPTAVVGSIRPGMAVRYTAEVLATNKLRSGTAEFTISFGSGDLLYTVSTFDLRTHGRR